MEQEKVWHDELPQLTAQTRNHADNFNSIYEKLLSNTKHNKDEISKKANLEHTHTKSEVTDFEHNHDDMYYTEQEVDGLLAEKASKAVATQEEDGLLSSIDKTKLDGIATGANNYEHPDDANTRHVTDEEKATWSSKASTDIATPEDNGLMSKEDKAKLDAIEANANNYVHPDNENTRHITDAERTKLEGIEAGANNYVHPSTSGNKHIPAGGTTGQILRWSADGTAEWGGEKASGGDGSGGSVTLPDIATPTANGLMSKEDKAKLDGIEAGANNYTHPDDENTRHVTDAEKEIWNGKASTAVATTSANGLMSSADKTKLNGVKAYAEENQNAFSTIDVNGSVKIKASSKTGTLMLKAGTGITLGTGYPANAVYISAEKPEAVTTVEKTMQLNENWISNSGNVIYLYVYGKIVTVCFSMITNRNGQTGVCGVLPEGCRPATTLIYSMNGGRFNINPDGTVSITAFGDNDFFYPVTFVAK